MKRVLLVYANSEYAKRLQEYINSIGHEVSAIIDSGEALFLSKEVLSATVAIVDNTIEKKNDGIEFAKALRRLNQEIHIIFTLPALDSEFEENFLEIKPSRVLLKPVDRNELRVTLKML
jgi:two-component SAPR family response regulator